ncbi:MAG: choice-of-anchor D domain-containing protein, partial [Rhodothermales bacterium]
MTLLFPARAAQAQIDETLLPLLRPRAMSVSVAAGATTTRTVTLDNPGTQLVTYAFLGFGDASFLTPSRGDAFGYIWTSNTDPEGPAFEWFDITSVGREHTLEDDEAEIVSLPFSFPFYGNIQTYVFLSSNGLLTFGTAGASSSRNRPIPFVTPPNDFIAPLWDNLNPELGGSIHTYHDAARDRFIVQYTDISHRTPTNGRYTFQVILDPQGGILLQYLEVGNTSGASVGIENDLGLDGLEFTFNPSGPNVVTDSLALLLMPPPDFVQITPTEGIVPSRGKQEITLSFDATRLAPGDYFVRLSVGTTHPAQTRLFLPITLTVAPPSFPFRLTPSQFDVTLNQGMTEQRTLTIENTDSGQAHSFNLTVRGARDSEASPQINPASPASVFEGISTAASKRHTPSLPGTTQGSESTAYSSNVFLGPTRANADLIRFDLTQPDSTEVFATVPLLYAGDYPLGDPDRLYVVTFADERVQSSKNLFQSVDLVTGRRTNIGRAEPQIAPATEVWMELATDPTDGTLYGATFDPSGNTSYLYRLDPQSGGATFISNIKNAPFVNAIAFDEEGILYGYEVRQQTPDVLIQINKRLGATTEIGPTGFSANRTQGMDFDPQTGTLYLAAFNNDLGRAELRRVNRQTGRTTLVAAYENGFQFGFLALPSNSFIEPGLFSGTVPPGSSLDLEVIFDARALLAGRYEASLMVAADGHNGVSEVAIPVQLDVLGSASMQISEDALDFRSVFVNGLESRSLLIENIGSDALRITRISFDNEVFSVDARLIDRPLPPVPPGALQVLPVRFRPLSPGLFTGTLTLETNDAIAPVVTIALRGEGVPAPEIALDRSELAVPAVVGRQHTTTLTIQNTGASDLAYQIERDTDLFHEALEPPLLAEGFQQGIPASWKVVDNAGTRVVWKPHTAFDPALEYSNYTGGRTIAAMASSHASPNKAFDTELRTPLLHATASNLRLSFLANYADRGGDALDFLDLDLSTDGGLTWANLQRWDENLGRIFEAPGRLVSVDLAPHVQSGDDFLLRWHYFDDRPNPATWPDASDWYVQIDSARILVDNEVMTVTPEAGTVPPQTSQEITLSFDADGLV